MSTLNVSPNPTFPDNDAKRIYRAFKGCDPAEVINILTHRNSTQRSLIQQEYRKMYNEELSTRFPSVFKDEQANAFKLWMINSAGREAVILKQGLSSESLNLEAATEVICSGTSSEIEQIKQIYHKKFGVALEHDIKRRTSGDHKELLLAYVRNPRYEDLNYHGELAKEDAMALYKAGGQYIGFNMKTFIDIFSEKSRQNLADISSAYHEMYDESLEEALKRVTEGYLKHALLTILQCSENPAMYFAKVLHEAMEGDGTDDTTLIRVIVTRTEIDMQYIKAEYAEKYRKTLNNAVHEKTSGHYRTFLLSLLGPNN